MELRKKEFTYRGETLDELKQLDVREFAKHLRSRERRHVLRQFNQIEEFVTKAKNRFKNNKKIKTHKRDLIVVPEMVGMTIQIYNGKSFIPVQIIGEMLGHKFGELAPSRGKTSHGKAGVGATKGSKFKSKK